MHKGLPSQRSTKEDRDRVKLRHAFFNKSSPEIRVSVRVRYAFLSMIPVRYQTGIIILMHVNQCTEYFGNISDFDVQLQETSRWVNYLEM